jgi:galactose-1-phosphate uridylyltransferase
MTDFVQRAQNEWRFDPFDEAFALIARNRRTTAPLAATLPESESSLWADQRCPFCEQHGPVPLDRVGGESGPAALAVPSPTPLCFVEDDAPPRAPFQAQGALGAHELLVVDGPQAHGLGVHDLDAETLGRLLSLFARRRADLAGDLRLESVTLSLAPPRLTRFGHAHATLLAAPYRAPRASSEATCSPCQEVADARGRGRAVLERDGFVAWVPFAPRSNVHLRIAPAAHGRDLLGGSHFPDHARELGQLIVELCRRVRSVAPEVPLALRVRPVPLREADDGFRGHLVAELVGVLDVDTLLGDALGVRVVTVPPEDLADRLRAAKAG